jgi:hypothetical protein
MANMGTAEKTAKERMNAKTAIGLNTTVHRNEVSSGGERGPGERGFG